MATPNDTPATIEIPLTKGYTAIVDACDSDLLDMKWHVGMSGYIPYAKTNVRIGSGYKLRPMHRMIMERIIDRPLLVDEFIDHIDNNSLNNSRSNLRVCTHSENVKNKRIYRRNKSGFKGVHLRKNGKYQAQIQVDGKKVHLGYFDNPQKAHDAYCNAAKQYHGEFARNE